MGTVWSTLGSQPAASGQIVVSSQAPNTTSLVYIPANTQFTTASAITAPTTTTTIAAVTMPTQQPAAMMPANLGWAEPQNQHATVVALPPHSGFTTVVVKY